MARAQIVATRPAISASPAIDVARARRETPGCDDWLHFNNAGAGLMPTPVLEAVIGHLRLEARRGGYEAANEAGPDLDRAYDSAARLLGCSRDEVAFVENATRAWGMVFYGIPFRPGDRILVSTAEYISNYLAILQVTRRTGAVVEVVPNDPEGDLSVEALRSMIDERVKLIALVHVPTDSGQVNPAAEVGRIARSAGVLYLLDACQSVGQMPVDVAEIGCDFLAGTGRKFLRGPRGTGFLYARRAVLDFEPPLIDSHAATWVARDRYEVRKDARRFENWEHYVAGQLGLAAAMRYAMDWGLDAIKARIDLLADRLRVGLAEIPGVTLVSRGRRQCGIVPFTIAGRDAAELKPALWARSINVAISPRNRLEMDVHRLENTARASVHYYNTEDEVDRFVDAVRAEVRAGPAAHPLPETRAR